MTSDQLHVPTNQITLPSAQTDISIMLPTAGLEDWDAELQRRASRTPSRARGTRSSATPGASHLARHADITLPRAQYDTSAYEDIDSMDFLSQGMGIASGDFDPDGGLDLGLDLLGDDVAAAPVQRRDSQGRIVDENGDVIDDRDDLSSIGVGRDAPADERERSLGSLPPIQDVTFGDLGGDDMPSFDISDSVLMPPPGAPASATQDTSLLLEEMTPRTKQQVAEAAQKRAADAAAKAAKDQRRQLIDSVTELDDDQPGRSNVFGKRNVDDIVTEEQYLPSSRAYAALLDIYNDPASHFGTALGGAKDHGLGSVFAGSDLYLAPELANTFVIDLDAHRAAKRARVAERQRSEQQAADVTDFSMEVGRRAPTAEAEGLSSFAGAAAADDTLMTLGGDDGANFDMPMLDDQPPPEFDMTIEGDSGLRRSERTKAGAKAAQRGDSPLDPSSQLGALPSLDDRLGTPDVGPDDLESFTPSSSRLLAAFETRPADAFTTPQEVAEQRRAAAAEDEAASRQASAQGWSKNTARAQRVLRSQLDASNVEESETSMNRIGQSASRRAAAGFFFELLVLGTKDQLKLDQEEPYSDIKIKAKSALWT